VFLKPGSRGVGSRLLNAIQIRDVFYIIWILWRVSVYFSPPLPFVPSGGRRSGVDSERPGASAAHVPYGALLKFSHLLG
jgi:hypothetical protein